MDADRGHIHTVKRLEGSAAFPYVRFNALSPGQGSYD